MTFRHHGIFYDQPKAQSFQKRYKTVLIKFYNATYLFYYKTKHPKNIFVANRYDATLI